MKRFITLSLCLLLCLLTATTSLVSCGGGETAYSLYSTAARALDRGCDVNMTMKMDITVGGSSQSVTVPMHVKQAGNNVEIEMEMMGTQMKILYVDGVMYTDMGEDGKYKQPMSLEEFMDQYGDSATTDETIPELTEAALANVELKQENGTYSFTVTLGPQYFEDIIESSLEGSGLEESAATVSDVEMTATFDGKKNLTSLKLSFSTSTVDTVIGEMTMGTTIEMTFVNPGEVPVITAPADADQYEAMPDMGDAAV